MLKIFIETNGTTFNILTYKLKSMIKINHVIMYIAKIRYIFWKR